MIGDRLAPDDESEVEKPDFHGKSMQPTHYARGRNCCVLLHGQRSAGRGSALPAGRRGGFQRSDRLLRRLISRIPFHPGDAAGEGCGGAPGPGTFPDSISFHPGYTPILSTPSWEPVNGFKVSE